MATDPNDVLSAAIAFRGKMEDMNDDVINAINGQNISSKDKKILTRAWGGLLNACDREVDRAATMVFSANDAKLSSAKSAIKNASDQLADAKKSLENIASTLQNLSQAVSLLGSAVKLLG